MPKLATATVGLVTERTADAPLPPYEPLMVPVIVPPTARVEIPKVALVEPAGTVTLDGTVIGSLADSDNAAPPAGAGAVSVAVPMTTPPPATLEALSEIEDSEDFAVTVSMGD